MYRDANSDPKTSSHPENIANGSKNALGNGPKKDPLVTWVHKKFQVTLLWCIICYLLVFCGIFYE